MKLDRFMLKRYLTLVFLLASVCFLKAQNVIDQNFNWGVGVGGTGTDYCQSIITDSSGNAILTGYFTNTIDVDPSSVTDDRTTNGFF